MARGLFTLPIVWTADGSHLLTGGLQAAVAPVAGRTDTRVLMSVHSETGTTAWSASTPAPPTDAVAVEGTELLAVAAGPEVRLLDTASGEQVGEPFATGGSGLTSVRSSSDGTRLLGVDNAGALWLWDWAARRQALPALCGHEGPARALALHGDQLVTVGGDGRRIFWSLRSSAWTRKACDAAGRELTREEWQRFLPSEAPRGTCHRGGG